MATHSSILAWRIPWTEEPGGYSPWGHTESDTTERLNNHMPLFVFKFLSRQTKQKGAAQKFEDSVGPPKDTENEGK